MQCVNKIYIFILKTCASGASCHPHRVSHVLQTPRAWERFQLLGTRQRREQLVGLNVQTVLSHARAKIEGKASLEPVVFILDGR